MRETWKNIPNYNGYQVSNLGRVRTNNKITHTDKHGDRHWKNRILKFKGKPNKSGYGTGLASNLFTSNAAGSVYYNLNQVTKNVWTINSAYNSGKVILLWQTTI